MTKNNLKKLIKECIKLVFYETNSLTSSQNYTDIFITDNGTDITLQNVTDNSVLKLPRYGVWVFDKIKESPQVKEIDDDLNYLMNKYKVPTTRVFKVKKQQIKECISEMVSESLVSIKKLKVGDLVFYLGKGPFKVSKIEPDNTYKGLFLFRLEMPNDSSKWVEKTVDVNDKDFRKTDNSTTISDYK